MLKRTLESEVMDSSEEALVYDQMDHASVNRLFVNDLLAAGLPAGETLDLGTGSARIPIELCQRSETARVVAVDLSINMLDTAKINLELANLTDRILLDHIDAKPVAVWGQSLSAGDVEQHCAPYSGSAARNTGCRQGHCGGWAIILSRPDAT